MSYNPVKEIVTSFETKGFVRKNAESHNSMHAALIVENSYNSVFCSDTSGVDFGKYKGEYLEEQQIPCLREMFCDNIMLFMLVPSSTIVGKRTKDCGVGSALISKFLTDFLESRGLESFGGIIAKRTIDLCDGGDKEVVDKKDGAAPPKKRPSKKRQPNEDEAVADAMDEACTKTVRGIIKEDASIVKRYRAAHTRPEDKDNYGFVSYKVSFSQHSYEDAVDFCTEYKDLFADKHIYLHEIDCTTDFACSFNKAELATYIKDLSRETDRKYNIVDNDKTVGKNCLSVLCKIDGCLVRCKVYNKFVQSLETRSATTRIGTHVDDWVNNREAPLRKTMEDSLDNGLTRIEITFYSGKVQSKDFYADELRHFSDLVLGSGKMFKCPIPMQWRAFSESLICNMAILDLDTKEYALGMWCNTLTRRVGGVAGTLSDNQFENLDRVIEWIAAHFSYDKGIINIATVKTDPCPFEPGTSDAVKWSPTTTLRLRSFVKSGDVRHTFVPGGTAGHLWYSSYEHHARYRKTDRSNNPQDRGLVDMPNIKLRIFDSKVEVRSKALCQSLQVSPAFETVSVLSLRKRGKKVEQDAEIASIAAKVAEITLANTQAIESASKSIESGRERALAIRSMHFGYGKTLVDFPKNTLLQCRAFKQYSGAYGSSYLVLDTNGDTYRSNAYLTTCINNSKHLTAFDNSTGIYFAFDYGTLFTCLRGGNYSTASGHVAAQTTMFRGVGFSAPVENVQSPPVALLNEIPQDFNRKNLAALEDLLLETTYVLQGISEYSFRGKTRYIIKIDGQHYISNHWLEENLCKPSAIDASKTNFQILKEGGVQTAFRTHFMSTNPKKKVELRCTAL